MWHLAAPPCYADPAGHRHAILWMMRQGRNAMKRIVFTLFQPATLVLIVLLWASAPASLLDNPWVITAASIGTLAMVQALEFVNERHAGWRLDLREFLTDLFYLILYYAVIVKLETKLV